MQIHERKETGREGGGRVAEGERAGGGCLGYECITGYGSSYPVYRDCIGYSTIRNKEIPIFTFTFNIF